MKLRKYAFTPSQWSSASNKIQVTNEEGNETTPATYSDKYSVDILWVDEPLKTSFTSYEVWCEPMGVHAMGGQKVREEWVEVCKSKRPELFPEPSVE